MKELGKIQVNHNLIRCKTKDQRDSSSGRKTKVRFMETPVVFGYNKNLNLGNSPHEMIYSKQWKSPEIVIALPIQSSNPTQQSTEVDCLGCLPKVRKEDVNGPIEPEEVRDKSMAIHEDQFKGEKYIYESNDWVEDFTSKLLHDQPMELVKEIEIQMLPNVNDAKAWFEWKLLPN